MALTHSSSPTRTKTLSGQTDVRIRPVLRESPLIKQPAPKPAVIRGGKATELRSADFLDLPAWVLTLNRLKQTTAGLAIVSCVSILSFYSWTVYTQQRWSKQYEVLEQMKRNERLYQLQQASLSTAFRDKATRSGMVPMMPERTIQVPVATTAPKAVTVDSPTPSVAKPDPFYPVGY